MRHPSHPSTRGILQPIPGCPQQQPQHTWNPATDSRLPSATRDAVAAARGMKARTVLIRLSLLPGKGWSLSGHNCIATPLSRFRSTWACTQNSRETDAERREQNNEVYPRFPVKSSDQTITSKERKTKTGAHRDE